MQFLPFLHQVIRSENLSAAQARDAMGLILEGQATPPQVAGFLVALRMKGETGEELLGFAQAMRGKSTPVAVRNNGQPLLDTCGTGGDGCDTFNISTVAAFVAAGAGVRVAKHGNRSISSRCGSADVLEALGVRIETSPDRMAASIQSVGIGFLFAPALHPAMKHAQAARTELKLRTAFNLLGPLTNPAGAAVQLIGAHSEAAAGLMAQALSQLGVCRAFVVHGNDGLDEITTTAESVCFDVRPGKVEREIWKPEDFGAARSTLSDLQGGDAAANAGIAREILDGAKGPRRDIVLVNASAALMAAGIAQTPSEGMRAAAHAIDSGAARERLNRLIAFGQNA